jgi:hypothetical protein
MAEGECWHLLTTEDYRDACSFISTMQMVGGKLQMAYYFGDVFRPPEGMTVGPALTLYVVGRILAGHSDGGKDAAAMLVAELDRRAEIKRRLLGGQGV